jgi:transposase
MNFLSEEERAQLKLQHKIERDKRICDRIKAVLLYDKGWSPKQIAEALLISEDTIRNYVDDYKSSKKLKPESGGSVEKLSLEQALQLVKHLENHTYLYTKDIAAYVESVFKIQYTIHGMRNWLQRHGFSYKKPSLVPGKADKEMQKKWIEEYEKLKQRLPKDETICFIDGVHPTHNVQPAYGWIKKGVRKEIPANSGRSRLNLSGMIDVILHKVIIQNDEMLNADSTISFFKKIADAYPSKNKIHLFCDNARYYRNKKVKEFLEKSKIQLHYLPPYSPNLNPIERLWKFMKERTIYNTYYQEFDDFKQAILGFFDGLANIHTESELAKAFMQRVKDNFSPIGAPIAPEF